MMMSCGQRQCIIVAARGDQRSMLVLVCLVIGNRVIGVITRAAYSCSYGLFGLFAASFACGIAREVPTAGVYR